NGRALSNRMKGSMMNAQLKNETLWIPTRFALQQIPGLDVDKTLSKLTTLHQQLLAAMLKKNVESIEISDNFHVTASDTFEIFTGDCFTLISPKGVRIIKNMFDYGYLEFSIARSEFPFSLTEYMIEDRNAESSNTNSAQILKKSKYNYFDYISLENLFHNTGAIGQPINKITIGYTTISRTIELDKDNQPTQILYSWENDACRTVELRNSCHTTEYTSLMFEKR
ncbi:MAG: hypothetical protein R3254_09575, partial [Thiomicrorhabdus sp.]|nr:hypothetical protein [Thiomicrorhabdus sp.]